MGILFGYLKVLTETVNVPLSDDRVENTSYGKKTFPQNTTVVCGGKDAQSISNKLDLPYVPSQGLWT